MGLLKCYKTPCLSSVCCQTSWQRESGQRALLSEYAADCGWSCWCVVAITEREAICTVRPQVRWQQIFSNWLLLIFFFCFIIIITFCLFVVSYYFKNHSCIKINIFIVIYEFSVSLSVLVSVPSPVLRWQMLWKNCMTSNQFIFSCLVLRHLMWVSPLVAVLHTHDTKCWL